MGVAFKTGLVSLWHDEPGRLWGSGRCLGHAMLMLSLGRAIMGTLSCVGVLYLWHRNYSWNAGLFFLRNLLESVVKVILFDSCFGIAML